MKYAWIKENSRRSNIELMCAVLGVGRSRYYDWRKNQPSARTLENKVLAVQIKEIFMQSRCH